MSNLRPIIKKKKKVMGGGHHGGAWKVAYADFVTAMMAFFLLMWLLNATSEEQREGLAEYFVQRIPISPVSGGGDGALKGDSLEAMGAKAASGRGAANAREDLDETSSSVSSNDGPSEKPAETDGVEQRDAAEGAAGEKAFSDIESAFESLSGESDVADTMLRHIRTRTTPEGLVIEVFDTEGETLFTAGSSEPTPMLRALLGMVASVAKLVDNDVAITGHTDSSPFVVNGDDGNWRLSSDRANGARRALLAEGLDPGRISEVSGKAGTQPLVDDPEDPRNRRVEITLLRRPPQEAHFDVPKGKPAAEAEGE
ncbi:flagellar motor protein MotB [Rubrimonas cliftonensis]|uniref:Chemotaxis protein MotB n=1 Tax=Rubrimonas cliftonensis TaxID=89524 RepID=A0A1H3VV47_9RHOB|nr:flagellar motor protein MotB [Rubrimonas cliftonensis]SDZ78646.1 chemotaxis protein MotB [Rubrimonas cliftonensis]